MKQLSIFLSVFALSALFLIGPAGEAQAQKADWLLYSSKRGGFKIKMPGTPELKNEEKKWGMSYKAQYHDGTHLYYVSYGKHNQAMPNPENLAEVSINAFTEKLNGTLLDNDKWKVGKYVGSSGYVDVPSKGLGMYYHVVFKGRTQYQVVMASQEGEPDKKMYKKFIKSFKFLK